MHRNGWVDGSVLTAVLVIAAVAGVWGALAIAFALLAGGIIHARDHQDAPYGGFARPTAVEPRAVARLVVSSHR